MSIIAIFSEVHSAGEAIAEQVANRLKYDFVGEDLLEEAAQAYGTSVEKLARAMGKRAFFNRATHEYEKSIVYIKAALARRLVKDNLVYWGPATHLIPSNISHVLKVGIIADPKFRIERAVEKGGIDPSQAEQQIEKADAEIAHWIEQLFGCGPWDSSLYDIKIPFPDTSLSDAISMIWENVAKDALKPNEQSVQAALDFLLATQVNMSLLENGYYYCDVTADGEKVTVQINKTPTASGTFPRAIQMYRYEQAEEKVKEICLGFEGVSKVETMPGSGYRKLSRALLVDDEEEYVLTLSQRLKTRDISSDVVHDGEQALSAVGGETPDVMVLDLKMPGIDGLEVLRRVKREHPEVEVIILTGHGCEQDERIAKELGAFAFLTKPVDIDDLAETMKQAYSKAESSAAHRQ
ncbi:MAG: response regulator [Proteobacteria bacterium]|nr:response regulator [Pseudomonadota bacterium]